MNEINRSRLNDLLLRDGKIILLDNRIKLVKVSPNFDGVLFYDEITYRERIFERTSRLGLILR
jgi:hypothetical protein